MTIGIAVVGRGAGTGLAGGANAVAGGIVLSTAGMNRIINIDERLRLATAECGVLTREPRGGRRRAGPVVSARPVVERGDTDAEVHGRRAFDEIVRAALISAGR